MVKGYTCYPGCQGRAGAPEVKDAEGGWESLQTWAQLKSVVMVGWLEGYGMRLRVYGRVEFEACNVYVYRKQESDLTPKTKVMEGFKRENS